MRLLVAVARDLFDFAIDILHGFLFGTEEKRDKALPLRTAVPLLHDGAHGAALIPERTTPKELKRNMVMYTSSLATPLRSAPGAFGDTVYSILPYGTMVMVLSEQDLWAEVASGTERGWVYVDDLEDRAAHVYPTFVHGMEYDAEDPHTIRLRAMIQDEFGAGELGLPLQCEEYVIYKLLRRGVRIVWPQVRPRTPGTWQTILNASPRVRFDNYPTVGAVMESRDDAEYTKGSLVYVEAVFADGSIQISRVDSNGSGEFEECVVKSDVWKGERNIFIIFE